MIQGIRHFLTTPGRRLAAVVVFANLLVFALVAVSLHASYRLYEERAAVTSRNTNRLVAQSIAGEIDRIDLGLQAVADEYSGQRDAGRIDPTALNAALARQQKRLPMVAGLRIADAEGNVVYGADFPVSARLSVSDRDYFIALRNAPDGGLVISKPVIGRIQGEWILLFARGLKRADGGFSGIVFATVTLDWFARKFSKLEVGSQGTVVMRGDASRNFDLLARVPVAGPPGQTTVSAQFRAMITANPQGGTYEAFAGADNIRRTFSYQSVGGYPIITLVGLATGDVFADWWREMVKQSGLAAAFSIMTLLGAWTVVRAWRAQDEAHKQLQFLAYHDVLTRLPNRHLLLDRFQQAQAYADRLKTKVALLFLDLDNFKTINDSLGHQTGDGLLKEVAMRLKECVRDTDTVSRQGGDEFILVLPNLSGLEGVAPILVKLMSRMQEPFHVDGEKLSTSVSIGIAMYPDDGTDFSTLGKKADMAMYRAKSAGRNTYRYFDEQMTIDAVEHLTISNGLRRAIEHNEFVLHYQPQIDLVTGRVIGVEALIRWQHPEMGLIFPGRFISVAEDTRLILPIGEWVLNEACRQAVAWKKAGLPAMVMAVNLSAVQFKRGDVDVEQTVVGALERSGHDPAYLELEITESLLIQNVDNVLTALGRLKRLGLKLSIDDFGTGYSSLAYLKRFNVDKLKIDQSFVRDLVTDPNDEAIVRAIIQMGHGLNLKVIAEGVETDDMRRMLGKMQCDEAQGYLFARPLAADELAHFVMSANAMADAKGPFAAS